MAYFFHKNINDRLSVKKYIDLMQTATDFRFNVFDMMSAPCLCEACTSLLQIQNI